MKRINKFMMVMILPIVLIASNAVASTINALNVKNIDKKSSILSFDFIGEAKISVNEDKKSNQIIIDVRGANLPASLTRVLDYSSMPGAILQISPYNMGLQGGDSRIVLQLRSAASYSTKQRGQHFELQILQNINDAFGAAVSGIHLPPIEKTAVAKTVKSVEKNTGWSEEDSLRLHNSANAKTEKSFETAKQLIEVLNGKEGEKIYHGSKVSFEASDADVHDIFRLVGDASGLNIITTKEVNAKLSLSLKDLPWDQMLDIVLQQNQLKASVVGNVVSVTTLASFNMDQAEKKKSLALEQQLEPVMMAIVPLSFSKAEDMKKMIDALVVKADPSAAPASQLDASSSQAPGGAGSGAKLAVKELAQDFLKGKIEIDQRSNSLVITNTAEVISRIKRLIKELDVALPQVLIDAKIVVASESFSKSLGVAWGGNISPDLTHRTGIGADFNGTAVNVNNPNQSNVGLFSISGTAGDPAKPSVSTGGIGIALGAGKAASLTAALTIGELEGTSKTIGSPRIIVNNKQSATVSDGTKIPVTSTTTTGNSSQSGTTFVDAVLGLSVTPQITSMGSILLDLDVHKDAPDGGSISTKSIKTQVLVDSGSTLVLGGVYQYAAIKGTTGIPLLKDLPFIGKFFGVEAESLAKTELMVFVTPKILEPSAQNIEVESK